jgi:hypothetical protein
MVTYDDADILALAWMAMFMACIIVALLVASLSGPKTGRRLPPPQPMATYRHKRWYRVTTSRLNDHRPNGGTRGEL